MGYEVNESQAKDEGIYCFGLVWNKPPPDGPSTVECTAFRGWVDERGFSEVPFISVHSGGFIKTSGRLFAAMSVARLIVERTSAAIVRHPNTVYYSMSAVQAQAAMDRIPERQRAKMSVCEMIQSTAIASCVSPDEEFVEIKPKFDLDLAAEYSDRVVPDFDALTFVTAPALSEFSPSMVRHHGLIRGVQHFARGDVVQVIRGNLRYPEWFAFCRVS